MNGYAILITMPLTPVYGGVQQNNIEEYNMKKLFIIMCGLPGSGKSTWAKECVENKENTAIISKDAIRTMINQKYIFDEKKEPVVRDIAISAIKPIIDNGMNIIIDDVNPTTVHRGQYIGIAIKNNYEPIIIYCDSRNNLENRMLNDRGYSRNKWKQIIDNISDIFEQPTAKECRIIYTIWNKL